MANERVLGDRREKAKTMDGATAVDGDQRLLGEPTKQAKDVEAVQRLEAEDLGIADLPATSEDRQTAKPDHDP